MAELIRIVSIVTTIQLLLFGGFVLLLRKKEEISHLFLCFFLIANAMFIAGFLVLLYLSANISVLLNFLFWGTTFGFLFGPLLYFYTKSVTQAGFKISAKFFIHFIPAVIYLMIIIFLFHIKSIDEKLWLINSGEVFPGQMRFWLNQAMNVQILFYMAASIFILKQYKDSLKNSFSEIEKIKLSWLNLVVWAFIFMWFLDLIHLLLIRLGYISQLVSNWLSLISLLINFIFAILIMYRGLKQPHYFESSVPAKGKVKYERSSLPKEKNEEYLVQLLSYMQNEKPYLIPTLTLNNLALGLKIQPKLLSQIINQNLNKNFYDFTNDYRINEAKVILSDSSKTEMTVLEILYECGFNSKSVFNTAFKRYTGLTPSEFRLKNFTVQVR
jgi:AraC-like DNA-binding protein